MTSSETIKQNRKFGNTIAVALLVLALYRIFIRHQQGWWVLFAIGMVLLLLAFIAPVVLSPLRWGWDKIGHVLGIINTYVLLTLFYFVILTPLSLIMRLFGKDILKLKWQSKHASYWESAAPKTGNGMKDQF